MWESKTRSLTTSAIADPPRSSRTSEPYAQNPPLVSIVTPCLNAERFIEEAILSVLDQDYPNIEYIVMDGGSTDGTIDILRKYEHLLRWETRVDHGAADAINSGFALGRGEILGFLSADDIYLPGAISAAVRFLGDNPEAAGVYGDGWWVDEEGRRIGMYPVGDFDRDMLERECFICQPASFMRRNPFENVGGLDPTFGLTFDYEFWLRFTRTYTMRRINAALAYSRMHRTTKTLGERGAVFRETFQVMRRHCGYVPFRWVYGYLCYRGDGRDQFFEPLQPSVLRYFLSLPVGAWLNWTRFSRYFSEWVQVMTWAGLRRRLRDYM